MGEREIPLLLLCLCSLQCGGCPAWPGAPVCGSSQAGNLLWLVGLSRGILEAFPGQDQGDRLGSCGSCSAEGNPVCSVASDKEGGECCPHPLCTQLVCQGKLLPWDAGTQRAGQASRSHEMRPKALLPAGNTRPEWGRRSPVCVHGSKCPGSDPGLRAAVPASAGVCYAIHRYPAALCVLAVPSSGCGSCASPPCCPLSPVHRLWVVLLSSCIPSLFPSAAFGPHQGT